MLYRLKVGLLKTPAGTKLWHRWRARRGDEVGNWHRLPEHVRKYAAGRTFADVGCMWGIDGEMAFVAEEAGATDVKGVDVYGPTEEFERKKQERNSSVEFILGDITRQDTIERVGVVDVVLCAGVLYHHPSPFDVLVALRRICRETLILRTATIPEVDGLPNAAVFYPMLEPRERRRWDLRSLGVGHQIGIWESFQPDAGYGNWFWGLTPSCVASMLATAGFRVDHRASETFAHTFFCTVAAVPFEHALPEPTARVE